VGGAKEVRGEGEGGAWGGGGEEGGEEGEGGGEEGEEEGEGGEGGDDEGKKMDKHLEALLHGLLQFNLDADEGARWIDKKDEDGVEAVDFSGGGVEHSDYDKEVGEAKGDDKISKRRGR
jgi:hypothetical protein